MKARLPEERKVNIQMLSFNDGERLTTALKGWVAPAAEGFLLRYADPQMDGVETVLRYDGARLHLSRNDGTRLTFEKDLPTAVRDILTLWATNSVTPSGSISRERATAGAISTAAVNGISPTILTFVTAIFVNSIKLWSH